MAKMSNETMAQIRIRKHMDAATDTLVAYKAPEIPALGNATPEGLLEQLGSVWAMRKELEGVEKILKERLSVLSNNSKKMTSDNFEYSKSVQERTALNQSAAKEYFDSIGRLSEFMNTSEVETVRIKER